MSSLWSRPETCIIVAAAVGDSARENVATLLSFVLFRVSSLTEEKKEGGNATIITVTLWNRYSADRIIGHYIYGQIGCMVNPLVVQHNNEKV